MSKIVVTCLLALVYSAQVFAQTTTNIQTTDLANALKQKYALAQEINDVDAAKDALLQLLAVQPSDTVTLFNLLRIYFETKQYNISYRLSKKYLLQFRSNITLLDFYSRSCELLTKYSEALTGYEKMYLLTDDIYYQYYAANIEYTTRHYDQCLKRIEDGLAKKLPKSVMKVVVTFTIGSAGETQQIDVFAAFNNLKGMLFAKTGRNSEAVLCYKKALEIEPNFVLAQENIHLLPVEIR
ncbi:MAG: hypothetical protein AB7P01_03850 [Bacteroidia bacterium]